MFDKYVSSPYIRGEMERVLPQIDEVVQNTARKFGLNALIAGGGPRDTTFGLLPKDMDIFLDISKMDHDDAEDAVLLTSFETMTALRAIFENEVNVWKSVDNDYEQNDFGERVKRKGDPWVIYDTSYEVFFREARGMIDPQDGLPPIRDERAYGFNLQFIGRPGDVTKPEEFVDTFDYGLVKTWYDSDKKEIAYHPDFQKEYETREIIAQDRKTERRAKAFAKKAQFAKLRTTRGWKEAIKPGADDLWVQDENGKWRRTEKGMAFYNATQAQMINQQRAQLLNVWQDLMQPQPVLNNVPWVPVDQPVGDVVQINDEPEMRLRDQVRDMGEPAEQLAEAIDEDILDDIRWDEEFDIEEIN